MNDAKAGRNGTPKEMASDFMDISEDLKFVLMNLERGGLSQPVESGMGVLVYRLNQVIPIESAQVRETDVNQVASFIRDKKREVLMEAWTRQLKENAEIWRDK